MRGDGDFGASGSNGGVDLVGGVTDRGGEDRGFGGEVEPALLFFCLAGEFGVGFAAGAHEPGADGGDADAFVAELGVESFGEAGERKLSTFTWEKSTKLLESAMESSRKLDRDFKTVSTLS